MSPVARRYVIAGLVAVILAGLFVWQHRREDMIRSCLEGGGEWNGAKSQCRYPPGRILIRPDLKRV